MNKFDEFLNRSREKAEEARNGVKLKHHDLLPDPVLDEYKKAKEGTEAFIGLFYVGWGLLGVIAIILYIAGLYDYAKRSLAVAGIPFFLMLVFLWLNGKVRSKIAKHLKSKP